jgi:cyclic beta-1,2-glucan synthetase
MAPHNADRQHPAFNKLFIQTEALPEQQVLLAYPATAE